jgi:hypothetical protein
LFLPRIMAFFGPPGIEFWWSRRESNPRPQALYRQFYILSPVIWF